MSGSRSAILSALRANAPTVDAPLPEIPTFARPGADMVTTFATAFERMGGALLIHDPADPMAVVRAAIDEAAVVYSCVPDYAGTVDFSPDADPRSLAHVDVTIVRAAFGVAETGSVCLTDAGLKINTSGYLAQHLIVLLDPAQIVVDIHAAYQRPEWRRHLYAALHSGPSATADIEGVLVRGAQGVRSLRLVLA